MKDEQIMSDANVMSVTSHIEGRNIRHACDIAGPWREAFLQNRQSGDLARLYGVRFPQIDSYPMDMSDLPPSIAVIPLLTNVLPIAWCYGATVHVDELDRDFYEAQQSLRRAFDAYYPVLRTEAGGLVANRLVDNRITEPKSPPLVLFSGGVDATFSFWGNRALKPTLVTIRGSDVYFSAEDDPAWEVMTQRHSDIARGAGVDFHTIESSFKIWLAHWKLNALSKKAKGWNWWFCQQHGAALIGLCAPLAWKLKSKRVIISSTFSSKDRLHSICGSNPSFDESLRFFGATVQHYDFTVTRQEKVAFLCECASIHDTRIPLRVCWQERTGHNCCRCEKCLRTIFGILAEDGDPKDFDFHATPDEIRSHVEGPAFRMGIFWVEIIERLRKSKSADLPHVRAVLDKSKATPALQQVWTPKS